MTAAGALHIGGAEAMHGVAVDPAGNVALRRHRVEVPGEYDEWSSPAGAASAPA